MGERSDQLNPYNDVSPVDRAYSAGDSESADTRAIEADIEQTRAQMSDTINAIQDRLNPHNLADQAKEAVVEATHNLAEQAKEAVYDATIGRAKGVSANMLDTIKENPLPAAIAALSIGWLLRKSGQRANLNQRYSPYSQAAYGSRGYRQVSYPSYGQGGYAQNYSQGGYAQPAYAQGGYAQDYSQSGYAQGGYAQDYSQGGYSQDYSQGTYAQGGYAQQSSGQEHSEGLGERVSEIADSVKDKATELRRDAMHQVEHLGDKATELRRDAMHQVEYLGDQAREQVEYASDWFQDTLYDTPLAIGAVALALGAAAGLSIPSTPIENRVMGEARDSLVEKVSDTAQETLDKVKTVAQEASETVKTAGEVVSDKVKLEAREQGLSR